MTRIVLAIALFLALGCGHTHHYTRVRASVSCWYGAGAVDVEHYARQEDNRETSKEQSRAIARSEGR